MRCSASSNLLFPNLYFQGCVIHCLYLLLENWGKETWVKNIVKREKVIVFFIQQHHVPLAIFCCYETKLMFLKHNKTWFATYFLMVEQFFKLKVVIEQIVTNPKWTTFVNTLCGMGTITNHVLWKNTSSPQPMFKVLKDFANFIESQGLFFDNPPSEWPQFAPTWMNLNPMHCLWFVLIVINFTLINFLYLYKCLTMMN